MRFFTVDWWRGVQDGADSDPSADYAVHLAAIRDRLPPNLLATQETVSLHDCRLRELHLSVAQASLTLILESYDADEQLTLRYSGVERFESFADPEVGLGGPHGYGDLGYTEADLLPDGNIEHRLLFSTGIEIAVAFRDFRLDRKALA